MATSFHCPNDDEDSQDLDSPPAKSQSFDWNEWGIDIDTKNLDALLDDDDDRPSSIEINIFRYDRRSEIRDVTRRAAK